MILDVAKVRTNGGTQIRAILRDDIVEEYAEAIRAGTSFPPVIVYYDGEAHWLADGFHRFAAYKAVGAQALPAEVRRGTQRDAILFAVGANASHGLPRTNADKRRAVMVLLEDREWGKRSDRWVAEKAGVSPMTVGRIRADIDPNCNKGTVARGGKDGRTRKPPKATAGRQPSPPQPAPAAERTPDPPPPAPKAPPPVRTEPAWRCTAHRDAVRSGLSALRIARKELNEDEWRWVMGEIDAMDLS